MILTLSYILKMYIKEEVMLVKKTMNLPKELLEEAVRLTDSPTQTTAVILALQDLVRRKKLEKLLSLRGKDKVKFPEGFTRESRRR
jgi:Arc/MetJ family transcription regulator